MIYLLGRLLASIVCIFGAPVHACICILIKMRDPGPALYRSLRLGIGGTPFRLLKYRTMKVNAPPIVTVGFKMVVAKADPRVTKLGKWLRCGLDELPQIWHIVSGEMAWVGPRPDEAWMLPYYGPLSRKRLGCLPGITGFAQVLDSRNLSTGEGFAIDLWYVAHRSLWLDVWIVLVTPLFIAGWRSIGRNRLARLRGLPEFTELCQHCDAELSASAIMRSAAESNDSQGA